MKSKLRIAIESPTPPNSRLVDAIAVLSRFALARVSASPSDEQIQVYHALAETLPGSVSRERARNLAVVTSRVAALELELHLSLQPKAGAGHN